MFVSFDFFFFFRCMWLFKGKGLGAIQKARKTWKEQYKDHFNHLNGLASEPSLNTDNTDKFHCISLNTTSEVSHNVHNVFVRLADCT